MANDSVEQHKQMVFWIGRIGHLPTLPTVVYKTIQVVDNPNSSIRQISDVLAQDQSLSTRVLRLANSSYYGIPGGVKTIERAVTSLGLETVSQLVFTTAVFSQFDLKSDGPFDIREYWKHSLGVAIASEVIAREVGAKDRSLIFLAGLMHDIGKLAHFQLDREQWLRICTNAQTNGLTSLESERALGEVPHDDLGYELIKHWQLPALIQEVVRSHHDTALLTSQAATIFSQAVGIVHLGNLLVHSMKFGSSGHTVVRHPSKDIVRRVLGNESAIVYVARAVREALEKAEPLIRELMTPASGEMSV